MKLRKVAVLASLMVCAFSALANEVTITNKSDHPIPVKYQFAYHNSGKRIVLKEKANTVVYANSKSIISIPKNNYDHAGIIVLAVKSLPNKDWHYLPKLAMKFDATPGCWMRTDVKNPSGNINLKETTYGSDGKHGNITCSTHIKTAKN